jgi:hypothetical protein
LWRRCRNGRGKRKGRLIENNVSGGDDTTCGELKTAVAAMCGWISEENTGAGPRGKLMRCGGKKVGVAQAPKDSEVTVGGRRPMEELVWNREANWLTRSKI